MEPSLRRAEADAVRTRLGAALEAAAGLVDRCEAIELAGPLPAGVESRLAALAGDAGAPEEWQLVADRVRAGLTTWHAVWCRPAAEGAGAMRLVRAVLVEQAGHLPRG